MRTKTVLLCAALAAVSVGCKKKGGTGGGGGWFVGEEGLMVDVDPGGRLGDGYDLGADERLDAIACRYLDEAWVAGTNGTLLYTSDAGATWDAHDVGVGAAHLRGLATQDAGPVFIVGDGVFLTAVPRPDDGVATWTNLAGGATPFRAVAAAQQADTVLAVSDDGGLWAYADGRLDRRDTLAGARGVAVSPDGTHAIVAGDGLARSRDGGRTWQAIDGAPEAFHAVRVEDSGEAVAVGAGGVVVRVDADGRVLRQTVGASDLRTLHLRPGGGNYSGTGYAAGDGGQIWVTRDGGWTWSEGPNVGRTVLGVDEIGFGHN